MVRRGLLLGAAIVLGGCLQPAANRCEGGGVCSPGMRCGMAGEVQICVAATCGNGWLDPGEVCDDGNNLSGDGCPADCREPCGDGVLDPGERCDDGNTIDGDGCDHNCTLTACGNGVVTAGEACDDGNAIDGDGCDTDCTSSALGQQAYVKASNTDYNDVFGTSVALSADGSTLAVGAPGEASATTEIGGVQSDNSAPGAGAVYVFSRRRTTWRQQAYVKASNTDAGDGLGCSVALSADGSTLAVGACGEDGAGTSGAVSDNAAPNAGAVYVFVRSGTSWLQEAYVKASSPGAGDAFGTSVALSADGSTLAVGATGEASAATGIDGDASDHTAAAAGAVYVFVRSGAIWRQQAYVKASNTDAGDGFGCNVALSADGSTLAVTATGEASAATGVDGDEASNAAPGAGAVYLFVRSGATWRQDAYVKASNTDPGDHFGSGLALSADGLTLAVGAANEGSAATGVGGNQKDDSAPSAGAVYLFSRTGARWSQQLYVKPSNTRGLDSFGKQLALSGDGARLAVAAEGEASAAVGVGGNQADNTAPNAGAVYLFTRSGAAWSQQAYVKASNTGEDDFFGGSVALSTDGTTLAVGGPGDDSVATGINGNQSADYTAAFTGAVYVFH